VRIGTLPAHKSTRRAFLKRTAEMDKHITEAVEVIFDYYFSNYSFTKKNTRLNDTAARMIKYVSTVGVSYFLYREYVETYKAHDKKMLDLLFDKRSKFTDETVESKLKEESEIPPEIFELIQPVFGVHLGTGVNEQISKEIVEHLRTIVSTKLWKDVPGLIRDLDVALKAGHGALASARDLKKYASSSKALNPKYLKKLERTYRDFLKKARKLGKSSASNPVLPEIQAQIRSIKQYTTQLREPPFGTAGTLRRWISKFENNFSEANMLLMFKDIAVKRTGYYARRVTRTENARANARAYLNATKNADVIVGYVFNLSAQHPRLDICDEYAENGPYYKSQGPPPIIPAHPHCFCYYTDLINLDISERAKNYIEEFGISRSTLINKFNLLSGRFK